MNSMQHIKISVNGSEVEVPDGASVAAAILISGSDSFRKSVDGSMRGPLCGMGVCYECKATVNGSQYTRTCMMICTEGMEINHD